MPNKHKDLLSMMSPSSKVTHPGAAASELKTDTVLLYRHVQMCECAHRREDMCNESLTFFVTDFKQ